MSIERQRLDSMEARIVSIQRSIDRMIATISADLPRASSHLNWIRGDLVRTDTLLDLEIIILRLQALYPKLDDVEYMKYDDFHYATKLCSKLIIDQLKSREVAKAPMDAPAGMRELYAQSPYICSGEYYTLSPLEKSECGNESPLTITFSIVSKQWSEDPVGMLHNITWNEKGHKVFAVSTDLTLPATVNSVALIVETLSKDKVVESLRNALEVRGIECPSFEEHVPAELIADKIVERGFGNDTVNAPGITYKLCADRGLMVKHLGTMKAWCQLTSFQQAYYHSLFIDDYEESLKLMKDKKNVCN